MVAETGSIRSSDLIESIEHHRNSPEGQSSPNDPDSSIIEQSEPHRKLLLFISFISVIGTVIIVNGLFSMQKFGKDSLSSSNHAYPLDNLDIFSTYYTGEYEICEDTVTVKDTYGNKSKKEGSCFKGNMHTTIIFRRVQLDGSRKMYMLVCLELPHSSRLVFWKYKPHGSNTYKNERRVYMGFSGLETTSRVGELYLYGLSSVMGPFKPKGPLKYYWPSDALTLDFWNEHPKKSTGPVCSFNTFVKQPLPSINQVSLRQIDEFYMMGVRRFLLKDFEQIAQIDNSKFNIFNLLYRETKPPTFKEEEAFTELDTNVLQPAESNEDNETLVDEIKGEIRSNDCGVTIKFSGQERDITRGDKLMYNFCISFILKSILEILLLCRELRYVDEGTQGKTLSIISFTMLSYQDAFEIFILLYHRALFVKTIISFCFVIFIKFFLVCIVDHSFLVLIWRANHAAQIREGWEATQKRFALFYRYYFSLLFLQLLAWYFYYVESPWILVLTYLAWIPQILLNAWRGQCESFHILTIIALSLCRTFLPSYIFMFSENAFTFDVFSADTARTNRTLGSLIIVVTLVQFILLCLQRLLGPRCFASWSLLPQIYNYVRPWTDMMQDDPQECVICMHSILHSERDWCITPCDHLFHTKCLKEWSSIKMECPNCRQQLPPIT